MSEEFDKEARILVQKEQWIQVTAASIVEAKKINPETALSSVRWASLWIDDFKLLRDGKAPTSVEEMKGCMEEAKVSSLERCHGLSRYPGGVPSLTSIVTAQEAFCMAFGDEAEEVRSLFFPNHNEYFFCKAL